VNQLQSLKEKSSLRQFADHVQDDEDVAGLLEDVREAISDYQVCLHNGLGAISNVDEANRWYNKWQCMSK